MKDPIETGLPDSGWKGAIVLTGLDDIGTKGALVPVAVIHIC